MAQAAVLSPEGGDRDPLSHYWLHSGPVSVEGQPMSKANRNVVPVRELLESGIRGTVVRVALLSKHYRDNLDFGEAALDRASDVVNVILGFREHLAGLPAGANEADAPAAQWIADTDAAFGAALDDDLDYWKAISSVAGAISGLEAETVGSPAQALDALGDWDRVLGIL
jgi:cysteinyl-tRNA synthetase